MATPVSHNSRQQQAWQTFQRDLPRLWAERPGQWVAYQGEQQLGFAFHKHTLYQDCLQRGLEREEFVIFCIEAQETEVSFGFVVSDTNC